MKKELKIVLLLLLMMIPVIVGAKSYSTGVNTANNHINKYSNYQDYLLYDNLPFVYESGSNKMSSDFKHGGFLNVEEYIISLPNDKTTSYLSIGDEFFLIQKKYVLAGATANDTYNGMNIIGLKNNVEDAGVRVTEFVKPETQVMGSGTMTNPWYFTANFNLTLEFPKGRMSSLEVMKDSKTTIYTPNETNDDKKLEKNCYNNNCELDLGRYKVGCTGNGCSVKLKISEFSEYKYAYNTCGGRIVGDYLVIDKLIKDTRCKLMFGGGTYKVTIGDDPTGKDANTSPKEVYLKYGENYYRIDSATQKITSNVLSKLDSLPGNRPGYNFKGYYYNEVQIINTSSKFIDKTTIAEDTTLKSKWDIITYQINYNLNGGTNDSTNPYTYTVESNITLKDPTKKGFAFTGWTGSNGTTPQKGIKIENKTGNLNYTANWKDNEAPTISLSGTNTLKVNEQTLTGSCSDNVGVTGYYLGTKSNPSDSDFKTSLSDLKISSAGTYYLVCKDKEGNRGSKSLTYYTYKIENRLQNVDKSKDSGFEYTSTDYTKIGSTLTYLAKKDSTLTLANIYTIPKYSRAGRFRGQSEGAAGTTAGTISKNDIKLDTNNKTYTMWFNRNLIYFKYKVLSDETFTANSNSSYKWKVVSEYVNRTLTTTSTDYSDTFSSVRTGVNKIDIYDNNSSRHFGITKAGYSPKANAEWACVSGCASGVSTISQSETLISNSDKELCDASSNDCTIVLKSNFNKVKYTIEYVTNGGVIPSTAKTSYYVTDDSYTLPTPNARSCYSFDGWYDNSSFSGSAITKIPSGSTGNKKYYAKWSGLKTIFVSSSGNNSNIGTSASPFNSIQTAYNCESVTTIKLLTNILQKTAISFNSNKTVTLTSNGGVKTISRDSSFTSGNVINLSKGTLTTTDIIFDGKSISSNGHLISSNNGSTLNLNTGTIIKNNINTKSNNGSGIISSGTNTKININGAEITNNKGQGGVGVLVTSGAYFVMNSGKISNNNGIGLQLWRASGVINNGSISNNKDSGVWFGTTDNAENIKITLTMNNGEISNNEINNIDTACGGGVIVVSSGKGNVATFNLKGGKITGNYIYSDYSYGAGVAIRCDSYDYYDCAVMNMSGGEISGNTSIGTGSIAGNGGGIDLNGIFNMSGGVIKNNTANQKGGGLLLHSGSATMTGGKIINNSVGLAGGGVAIIVGTFTFKGGEITGNRCDRANYAGGIDNSSNSNAIYNYVGGNLSNNTPINYIKH